MPSRASTAVAAVLGRGCVVALARPPRRRPRPSAAGVSRPSRKRVAKRCDQRAGRRRGRAREGCPPASEPLDRGRRSPRRATPTRRRASAPAAPAGSPSGRRPRRAASRRGPGCRATSTSSRRRSRPSPGARRPGRTGAAPVITVACAALISWCGKTRSSPPPWTSIVGAEMLQRDRRALDVPARPAVPER